MRFFQLVLLFLAIYSLTNGQSAKKNAAYVELGGTALLYSINYDRLVAKGRVIQLNARVGFATLLEEEFYLIPMEITGSIGRKNRFFEFGPGYALTKGRDEGLGSIRLGYRVEKTKAIVRAAIILFPSIVTGDISGMLPWAGISYGFRF